MAVIGINPINRQPKKDTLDRIAQGLDIAQSVLGIGLAIPDYLQKKKTGALQQAESRATIGEKTEIAKPGEEGAFEVPGMGLRKPMPSLQRQIQEATISENKAESIAPTSEEYEAFKKVSPNSDIETLKKIYPTRGTLRDAYNKVLGATTIRMEDPFASKKFEYDKSVDVEKKKREKEERFVPSLRQYALTSKDATETKEAIATHKSIKKSVQELIDLRSRYTGGTLGTGTVTNREDVAKAKQIATKLLFKYKKLETLGVLSKTDTELVNKLIPTDPLEFNPSGIVGQDPTMETLKNILNIADDDIDIFLETRGFTLGDKSVPSDNKGVSKQEAENF